MTILTARGKIPGMVYHVMSDQPDCCPSCQTRLDLVEAILINDERVFVNFCEECRCEILIVED
ncbi:MAG: hypothetical protein HOO95_04850 [Gallionella sp.]|nr:hypothetical protein [Gallionella sp.]